MSSKSSKSDASSPPTQEYKYERVEKLDVDKDGNTISKGVGVGTGKTDPGLNFTDRAPAALVPGNPNGMAPGSVSAPGTVSSSSSEFRSSVGDNGYSKTSSSSSKSSTYVEPQVNRGEFTRVRDGPMNTEGAGVRHGSTHSSHSTHVESNVVRDLPQRVPIQKDIVVGTGEAVEHHEREVYKHSSGSRQRTEEIISVPVTHYESGKMESIVDSTTTTVAKPILIPGPQLAAPLTPARMEVRMGGVNAEVHAHTKLDLTDAQIKQIGPEEYERYRQKVERLARAHEFETAGKAAAYRAEVEADAALICRTLEKQHIRDIDFQRERMESDIERQEREIQLEVEYAMRVLEKERENARNALERAKAQSSIEVNIESAVGTTHSVAHMTTESEKTSTETRGPQSTVVRDAPVPSNRAARV